MVNKKEKYLVKIYRLCDLISIGYPRLVQIKGPVEQEELGNYILYLLISSPGVCYRLYSTSVYSNLLIPYTEPEIISSPLEPTILSLYSIGLKDPLTFPFPTAPD